ncbi:hypothetical protein [Methylobacterium sp. J-070]|uniref:PDC sensor domain-containing protein n=1 Tax=Methylobacterium sp. J-070 TaxID=2836650 RepID=UPI001FB926D9|nr:hypothetical protein [Methylobacterium sp. J-070]MCJ2051804.1 hypothetical protein [Methylobacterium sp. J-070]
MNAASWGTMGIRDPQIMTTLFWIVWATCVVALAIPTGLWAKQTHSEALAAARKDVVSVAQSGAQFTENTFGLIDVVLNRLAELSSDKNFGSASIDKLCPSPICSNYRRLSPYLLLGFARANGDVVVHGPDAKKLNVGDRDYFIAQKERDAGLFVGAPRRTSFMRGTALPMSRRLSSTDGVFEGIVAAVIDVDLIEAVFKGLGAGKADEVRLLNDKGLRLVGWSADTVGDSAGSARRTDGSACGSASRYSSPDIIASTESAQMGNLSVKVCLSTANVLQAWRAEVLSVAGAEGLVLLAPALAFPALRRRWQHRLRQRRGL